MVYVEERERDVTVSGNAVECALFFAVWQTHLWKEWCTDNVDQMTVQATQAVKELKESGSVALYNASSEHKNALQSTIDWCERVGIQVCQP